MSGSSPTEVENREEKHSVSSSQIAKSNTKKIVIGFYGQFFGKTTSLLRGIEKRSQNLSLAIPITAGSMAVRFVNVLILKTGSKII